MHASGAATLVCDMSHGLPEGTGEGIHFLWEEQDSLLFSARFEQMWDGGLHAAQEVALGQC